MATICQLSAIIDGFTIFYSFQSETCNLLLPDLEFEMGGHGLGGRFTTLEGLLRNVAEKLENNPFLVSYTNSVILACVQKVLRGKHLHIMKKNSFIHSQGTGSADGDSATDETQRRMREFRTRLDELTDGKRDFTFVMDDPSGNSYLQVCAKFRRDVPRRYLTKYAAAFSVAFYDFMDRACRSHTYATFTWVIIS